VEEEEEEAVEVAEVAEEANQQQNNKLLAKQLPHHPEAKPSKE
jgi:hypothetical protein